MLRKLLGTAVVAWSFGAVPAHAIPIELSLVLDASGSISDANWDLQRDAYAGALLALLPSDGTVAVSVVRFANSASVVRPMTVIGSAADLASLSTFFTTLSQSGNGASTCISCGILAAEGTFTGTADRAVIDVSTDGEFNTGVNPAGPAGTPGTSQWAVANDADVVNALGIGTSTAPNFAFGTGSFSLLAPDFASFQTTLETKLRRETGGGGTTPEPHTLALFAMIAMIGAYTLRSRRA